MAKYKVSNHWQQQLNKNLPSVFSSSLPRTSYDFATSARGEELVLCRDNFPHQTRKPSPRSRSLGTRVQPWWWLAAPPMTPTHPGLILTIWSAQPVLVGTGVRK